MDEQDPNERRQPPQRNREFTWGVFVPVAALVFSAGVWGFDRFMDLIDRISDLDSAVTSNTEHRLIHDEQSKHWISQILRNLDDVRQLERDLAELRSVPSARPDPFTGSEGNALERRIHDLESMINRPVQP